MVSHNRGEGEQPIRPGLNIVSLSPRDPRREILSRRARSLAPLLIRPQLSPPIMLQVQAAVAQSRVQPGNFSSATSTPRHAATTLGSHHQAAPQVESGILPPVSVPCHPPQ